MGLVRRPLAAVCPALHMGGGGRGKGQTPAQRRFVPYKLAGEFEVYPEEVPEYAPWTTELGMSRLPFTLDSLRQGELWLDAQRRLFASSVNEDQIARDQLLEETRQQVRRLEEVVRHQNIAIADLGRQCAQLSNRQNGIEKNNASRNGHFTFRDGSTDIGCQSTAGPWRHKVCSRIPRRTVQRTSKNVHCSQGRQWPAIADDTVN